MTAVTGIGPQVDHPVDVIGTAAGVGVTIIAAVIGSIHIEPRTAGSIQMDTVRIRQRGAAVRTIRLVAAATFAGGRQIPVGSRSGGSVTVTINRTGTVRSVRGCPQIQTDRGAVERDIGGAVDVSPADRPGGQGGGVGRGICMTDLATVTGVQMLQVGR